MKTLSHLFTSIKAEILKLKNSFAFWLSALSALFIPFIYFLYYTFKYKTLIPKEGVNPWDKFIMDQIIASGSLLIPMFIILIISLIIQLEYKSSGVKYIFSQPIPKWSIYFGKLIVAIGLIFVTYLLFLIGILLSGFAVGNLHDELKLLEYTPDLLRPVTYLFRSFTALLGVVAIQFWLSFRIKNFIIPLGLGIVLIITGLIIFGSEESSLFPYAYGRLSLFQIKGESTINLIWFPKVVIYSLLYFSIASVLGCLNIHKMNIK